MTTKQSLAKLEKILLRRRDALRRSVNDELTNLQVVESSVGDSIDAALDSSYDELSSQLAQAESRELANIENALARLREGQYGRCESCEGRIPAARLKALPYATLCVQCQRDEERVGGLSSARRRDLTALLDEVEDEDEISVSEAEAQAGS